MPRSGRIVIPGVAHHIIQRGSRRQKVFFSDEDKEAYLKYLERHAKPEGLDFLAYCLMDNHVHLIIVPETKLSLANGLGKVHRRYTALVNSRQGWRGFLWEGRFKSYLLTPLHLYSAVRYVECNPIRAGLVDKAENYQWSSAHLHIAGETGPLLSNLPQIDFVDNWNSYLRDGEQSPS